MLMVWISGLEDRWWSVSCVSRLRAPIADKERSSNWTECRFRMMRSGDDFRSKLSVAFGLEG